MRSTVLAAGGLALFALAPACTSPAADPEPTGRAGLAVTSGTDDGNDPAVVAIVDATGRAVCSATVVGTHLVLTAAHCALPEVVQGAHVAFGESVAGASAVPIVAARAHPAFDPVTFANDIALLVLASPAPAPPVILGSGAPAVAATVRVVGYGYTSADGGGLGTKRQGTALVSGVAATTFEVAPDPSQPCEGDSGGPAFFTAAGAEALVGVTSHGDSTCTQHATYTRVDAFTTDFIAPTMSSFADGSAPVGARCLFPEQCSGGAAACVAAADDPNVSYCTAACSTNGDCPANMQCAAAASGASQCRYSAPTPGAIGAACASDSDCVDGTCTTAGVCAVRCVPGGASCPSGFECDDVEGGIDFFCLRSPSPPSTVSGSCALALPKGASLAWLLAPAGLAIGRLARRRRQTSPR